VLSQRHRRLESTRALASDRVILDAVVAKYCDHVPLYRQSAIVERERGVEISRATMDGWVMRVGEFLSPIAAAIGRELVTDTYIQADETPVGVQMHDGRGKNHQAYLWQYGKPGGSVVFDFRLGRGREGPKRFLGQFEGILVEWRFSFWGQGIIEGFEHLHSPSNCRCNPSVRQRAGLQFHCRPNSST
jgi:hypothetical protein